MDDLQILTDQFGDKLAFHRVGNVVVVKVTEGGEISSVGPFPFSSVQDALDAINPEPKS